MSEPTAAPAPDPVLARRAVPLSTLSKGDSGRCCCEQVGADDRAVLAAMGMCQSTHVKVCRRGRVCVVDIGEPGGSIVRVALARTIADRVRVV